MKKDNTTVKAILRNVDWIEELRSLGSTNSTSKLFQEVPLLYRAVTTCANAASAIPVIIRNSKGDEVDKWPIGGEQLNDLIWRTEAWLRLKGCAYWEKAVNSRGIVTGLKLVNPNTVEVEYKRGEIIFRQDGVVKWTNKPDQNIYGIVHFKEFSPLLDVEDGVGSAEVAVNAANLRRSLTLFQQKYFEKGAMPVTLIGVENANQSDLDLITNWFERLALRIGNALGVGAFRAGNMNVQKITSDLKDMAFNDVNRSVEIDIIDAFGLRESMIRSSAANYATAQEDRKGFYEDEMEPRMNRISATINQQLFTAKEYTIEFDIRRMSLFQDDESDKFSRLDTMLNKPDIPTDLAFELAGVELSEEQVQRLEEGKAAVIDDDNEPDDVLKTELARWQRMAEKRIKNGQSLRAFESEIIPGSLNATISAALEEVQTTDDVRAVFANATEWRGYP